MYMRPYMIWYRYQIKSFTQRVQFQMGVHCSVDSIAVGNGSASLGILGAGVDTGVTVSFKGVSGGAVLAVLVLVLVLGLLVLLLLNGSCGLANPLVNISRVCLKKSVAGLTGFVGVEGSASVLVEAWR